MLLNLDIYSPKYLSNSYTKKDGHTKALKNSKTPIQKVLALDIK